MSAFAITQDMLTPKLQWYLGLARARGKGGVMLRSWGIAIQNEAQENCEGKGGRSFWREMARSLRLRKDGAAVQVEATHVAAAQKQFGGMIEARGKGAGGADALTIPITEEARDRTAADFENAGLDLFALGMDDGDESGVLGYDEGDGFVPLFALRRRLKEDQKPDPFMPDEKRTAELGEQIGAKLVKRK